MKIKQLKFIDIIIFTLRLYYKFCDFLRNIVNSIFVAGFRDFILVFHIV